MRVGSRAWRHEHAREQRALKQPQLCAYWHDATGGEFVRRNLTAMVVVDRALAMQRRRRRARGDAGSGGGGGDSGSGGGGSSSSGNGGSSSGGDGGGGGGGGDPGGSSSSGADPSAARHERLIDLLARRDPTEREELQRQLRWASHELDISIVADEASRRQAAAAAAGDGGGGDGGEGSSGGGGDGSAGGEGGGGGRAQGRGRGRGRGRGSWAERHNKEQPKLQLYMLEAFAGTAVLSKVAKRDHGWDNQYLDKRGDAMRRGEPGLAEQVLRPLPPYLQLLMPPNTPLGAYAPPLLCLSRAGLDPGGVGGRAARQRRAARRQ